MKKKNVILLVIDSLAADEMFTENGVCAMPFFHKLVKESIYLSNFYSGGPHTEPSLKALLCGTDTMENNGYMRRFSDSDRMVMDYFHDNGYSVFNFCDMLTFFPKRVDDVCSRYYTTFLGFAGSLVHRLPYFSEIYKEGMLDEIDIMDLIRLYDELFRANIAFYSGNKDDENYVLLKNRMKDVPFDFLADLHIKEYNVFAKNKVDYVMRDIRSGKCNDNLAVDLQKFTNEINYTKLHKLNEKEKRLIRYLQYKNVVENIFDYRNFSDIRTIKNLLKVPTKNQQLSFQMGGILDRIRGVKNFNLDAPRINGMHERSFRSTLDFLVNFVKNTQKYPYFIYMHTNNLHYGPIEFFSQDGNEDIICSELNDARRLLAETKHYHGHMGYLLGMKYIDNCLKAFLHKFNNDDSFKDTLLVITADHGSSYGSSPVRDKPFFNNCHSELFHIPLLLYERGIKPRYIQQPYTGKDFLPSLLDYCGIEKDSYITGHSVFDSTYGSNIIHSERIGSGCPCINHRKIIYTARNNQWLVEYEVGVYNNFSQGVLTEAYNLEKDPDEMHNVSVTMDKKDIKDLLLYLEDRHVKLQKNYHDWKENHGYKI